MTAFNVQEIVEAYMTTVASDPLQADKSLVLTLNTLSNGDVDIYNNMIQTVAAALHNRYVEMREAKVAAEASALVEAPSAEQVAE